MSNDVKRDFIAEDAEEATRFADAFIGWVNSDHEDVSMIGRDAGCRIRDHIEGLRRELTALDKKQEDRITGLEAHNVTLIAEGLRQNDRIAQLEATVQRLSAPVSGHDLLVYDDAYMDQAGSRGGSIRAGLEAFIANRLKEPTNGAA